MPQWSDLMKLFTLAFRANPIERERNAREIKGSGQLAPDVVGSLSSNQDGFWSGSSKGLLRVSTDFVDLSSCSNRQARMKEYERLRCMPEIETALTVFADEMCVAGDTKIATPFGFITIEELANCKKPGERFLIYAYDFSKRDFTLAWAHSPRLVKKAPVRTTVFDNGKKITTTYDHRLLLRDNNWIEAQDLKNNMDLMPFYRNKANSKINHLKSRQFARVFTLNDGWKNERQFIDEWKVGKELPKYNRINKITRFVKEHLSANDICQLLEVSWDTVRKTAQKQGFTYQELKHLAENSPDSRSVVGWYPHTGDKPVYDLSVDIHENFCTDCVVAHNCQLGENTRVFDVKCDDDEIKKEAELLLYEILEVEDWIWNEAKSLCLHGDRFWEVIISPENPKGGVVKVQTLPPDSMFRIETTQGKLLEFQQSKEGPDYQSLARVEVTKATDADLASATAIRFAPEQIVHIKIGDDRKTFYPYGISLVEAARGPAHQLRLLEDSLVVYRLSRSPERRIFYIDVQQLPPFKAEAFMERMKDQFRKKKVHTNKGGGQGASSVDERWAAPAIDEDYWLPVRPNSNTRIETLPGANNLSEIEDVLHFRDKLFIALNFPKNYASQDTDSAHTRITLSSQDVKFARLIERLQKSLAKGLREIVIRHLRLLGYPEEKWGGLQIKMTPPSDWREISRNEVMEARYNRAAAMKGAQLLSDYDILVDILHFDESVAKEYVARMKQQKLEDLKLQVMGQNPALLGLGQPPSDEKEIGVDGDGPNTNPTPPAESGGGNEQEGQQQQPSSAGSSSPALPDVTDEDAKKYNLEIRNYNREIDFEEVDNQELGDL